MNKLFKGVFMIGIIALLFLLPSKLAKASEIQAPLILDIVNKEKSTARPLVVGFVEKDLDVLVYINDIFVGNANINKSETETDNFYFQPNYNLVTGEHKIKTIAKDKVSLVLSDFSDEVVFIVPELSAPTLINPNAQTVTAKVRPVITGLVKSGSRALIYVDGVFDGKTNYLGHESGVANFAYKPFLNLEVGKHTVWVVAQDEDGRKSKISNIQKFNIELPLPPATLVKVIENKIDNKRPFVVGLVKNDLYIKVYVDHKIDGIIKVENDISGTGDFSFKLRNDLTPGSHLVYVVTEDDRGKESLWSNFVVAEISEVVIPRISEVAEIEKSEDTIDNETAEKRVLQNREIIESVQEKNQVDDIVELKDENYKKEELGDNNENTQEVKKDNNINSELIGKDLDEILNKEISTSTEEETGVITEDKDEQGKSWSVFIFTLFLMAVVGWIFWVNKELIKEKSKEEDEKE